MQMIAHSFRTLLKPRSRHWRKPRAAFICRRQVRRSAFAGEAASLAAPFEIDIHFRHVSASGDASLAGVAGLGRLGLVIFASRFCLSAIHAGIAAAFAMIGILRRVGALRLLQPARHLCLQRALSASMRP